MPANWLSPTAADVNTEWHTSATASTGRKGPQALTATPPMLSHPEVTLAMGINEA